MRSVAMFRAMLVLVGGGAGSLLRYWVSGSTTPQAGIGFPWGTLTVNFVGCFLIGFLNVLLLNRVLGDQYRILLVVGVLGGFTTFSSFAWESVNLGNQGQFGVALVNVAVFETSVAWPWPGSATAWPSGWFGIH